MTTAPKVSIIIPCFNSAWSLPKLAQCLQSVPASQVEIIFVDDGSTDNSYELFRALVPHAKCIKQENHGLGATRNRAAEIASGEYLQLLDADDTIEPNKIEAQLPFALENRLDVVYSDWRMVIVDATGEHAGLFNQGEAPVEIVEALLGGWWYPPNAQLIKRDAYFRVGGCDPALGNTCEDFDLDVRLALTGCKVGYLPGPFASYYRYLHRKSMSRKDRREYFEGEERVILKALSLLKDAGTLTLTRQRAAARRLHLIARNVYPIDKVWFNRLIAIVYKLDPGFAPLGSFAYRMAAHVFGFENAERMASRSRDFRMRWLPSSNEYKLPWTLKQPPGFQQASPPK